MDRQRETLEHPVLHGMSSSDASPQGSWNHGEEELERALSWQLEEMDDITEIRPVDATEGTLAYTNRFW